MTRTEEVWADALKRPSKQGPGLWEYVAGEMKQLCAELERETDNRDYSAEEWQRLHEEVRERDSIISALEARVKELKGILDKDYRGGV